MGGLSMRRAGTIGAVLLLLAAAILLPLGQKTYFVYIMTSWLIFAIAAMGLNLTLGYAGQISLAQASFMAIGAYTTALMTLAGWHWMLSLPLGLLLCFVVGLLLGYPALRVKGHFLVQVKNGSPVVIGTVPAN